MNNQDYDFCIVITTYNRPVMLNQLLTQLKNQEGDFKIKIIILDDNSSEIYDLPNWVTTIKFYPNNGKYGFWKIIDKSFKYIKNIQSKYYIYIQDDVTICEDFFNKVVTFYENIKDENKICLNFFTDSRVTRKNWTDYDPHEFDDVIKTQWVEFHFIAEKKFFKELNYFIESIPLSRWDNNKNLSSGVGQQMSVRLNNLGKGMYHTKKSLVFHGNHDSLMNYEERKINQIISN